MKMITHKWILFALASIVCATMNAQDNNKLAVESFAKDEKDQAARITNSRKDKNDKVCAILKIETPLSLQDITFDAGMTGVEHSEQKNGEIWLWVSPGTQRLTITHKNLGTVRNYPFGETLKEATVYILKLKSGSVETIVRENVALQYMEIICEIEGATVKIDETAAEPFINGRFQKLLSYGKHRYTVEAPMHYPEIGIAEISVQKSEPVSLTLKPKFGKLTVNTEPEQGADVFIDDEKKGQSPLTIERIGSGNHKIHVMKSMFLPATQEITVTEGATASHTLNLQPNFAVVTLTTSDGGDIYINDERKAFTQWNGRLTQGQYKVEVRKPSHRPSTTAIEVRAGIDTSIALKALAPIYGSLNVTTDNYVKATIFVDNKEQGSTPAFIGNVLTGSHDITLKAEGYQPATKKVEVTEGKIEEVKISMQEVEKSSLVASNEKSLQEAEKIRLLTTPESQRESKKNTTSDPWKSKTLDPVLIVNYRLSPPTSIVGASVGYCKRFGGYVQFRTDILEDGTPLAEKDLVNEYFSGGDREYFRTSYTAGAMLRLFNFMYIYGGAGYGKYGTVYKQSNAYAYIDPYYTAGLIKGIELEYGINFKIWKISVAAGYSTIAESDFGELHFGLGIAL